MSTDYFRDLNSEEPMPLKGGDFKLWASIGDPDFDNDDNPYAKIIMYYYSNLETRNSSYPNEEVPMVPCTNDWIEPNVAEIWYPGTVYCPDWSDRHVLFATYRHNIFSWVRFAVKKCDREARALEGKECASDEEINDFLSTYIYTI
jgi:hypothetical protein